MNLSKKSIFHLAWKLYKANIFSNFSDALKAAWKQATQGQNEVTFIKVSTGEKTTRRIANITERYYKAKGAAKKISSDVLRFVDLDKFEAGINHFIISFRPSQVISFS